MKFAQVTLAKPERNVCLRHRFWSIIAVLSMALIVGCSEGRVAQCNRLIEIANQAAGEVESVTQSASADDPEAFRTVANAADQAARDLEAIELSDPNLQDYKQRFISLYVETSAATQALVEAVEQQDTEAATQAYERLELATQQESPLVDEVNNYCQGEG